MEMNIWAGISGCLAFLAAAALAAENTKTVSLLNGRDLSGWQTVGGKGKNQWEFGRAILDPANPRALRVDGPGPELVSPASGANLATQASFKDCLLQTEFMMAKDSNSGIKLMNIYEIQLFDSFGKAAADKGDCGAVYQEAAPKVNACKKPGEWQSLLIQFRAPRFDEAGNKTANACFVRVVLNGQAIQENVELARGTGAGGRVAKEKPAGPVYLQGDHGPVAFRNMSITPLN
jgi:hypothetical protein